MKILFNQLNKFLYKEFFINLKIFIIYIIGAFYYYLSLTKINGGKMECFNKKNYKCFFTLARLTLSSSIIISSIFIFIITFKKNKIHIFIVFNIYIFFFILDHEAGLVNHGIYNFIAFIITTFIIFVFLYYINCLKNLYKKTKYFILALYILIFPFVFLTFKIYKLNHFNCKDWDKGFNNTYIDNNSKDYPCIMNIPKSHSCYLSEIGPYFDLTPKYRPTCLNEKISISQTKIFYKSLNNIKFYNLSKKKYFGYPLTNNEKFKIREYGNLCIPGKKNFEKEIHKNIILMDLYNKNKTKYYPNESKPEIYISFKNGKGKIKIKVQKNHTLIEEREKISKKTRNKQMFKNVMVMFFDTISRAHFFRKFPKTIKFLNKFSKYETNYKKKSLTIFQFFKFNSINTYTLPNLKAAYYGVKANGKGIHFANHFKKNGYIIGKISTFCTKVSVVNQNKTLKYPKWDHEGTSLSCIKGIYNSIFLNKMTSLVKKCLFGKEVFQYALEYLESFWETYYKYNKMFLFESGEGHEPTGELIGHLDTLLYNFLFKFYSKNYLKNTTFLLFSDHGQHLNGPLYLTDSQDFLFERTLPVLLLIISNDKDLYKDKLYEKIKNNQQVFVTPFDIYCTLIHIALRDETKIFKKKSFFYGSSLLTKLDYKKRFCQSPLYNFKIKYRSCNCIKKHD